MSHRMNGELRHHVRFDWVVKGQQRGPLAVFDEPLIADAEGVALPSLGSIVPGWTLLVPRHTSPNIAALGRYGRDALKRLREEVLVRLSASFEGVIYEFEHGPAMIGSILGCGVDQAHLHLVPLSFDLVDAAHSISGKLIEFSGEKSDPWELVPSAKNYFLIRNSSSGDGVIVFPSRLESQAIRKIIATRMRLDSNWDYRLAAGLKQAALTRLAFNSHAI
jgi:ATP adenylyltransferase